MHVSVAVVWRVDDTSESSQELHPDAGWGNIQRTSLSIDTVRHTARMHIHTLDAQVASAFVRPSLPRESAWMLALVLSLRSTSLHTPGVNARLSNRAFANARSSVRMITLVDEVDEKAMLVRRASHA